MLASGRRQLTPSLDGRNKPFSMRWKTIWILQGQSVCWVIWRRLASLVSCQTMKCLLLACKFARWQISLVCVWTKPPSSRGQLAKELSENKLCKEKEDVIACEA